MDRKHNIELTTNARTLRKNMTKEERNLWYDFLKSYPIRFLRQKVIDNYIVDFCCKVKNLCRTSSMKTHHFNDGFLFIQLLQILQDFWVYQCHNYLKVHSSMQDTGMAQC